MHCTAVVINWSGIAHHKQHVRKRPLEATQPASCTAPAFFSETPTRKHEQLSWVSSGLPWLKIFILTSLWDDLKSRPNKKTGQKRMGSKSISGTKPHQTQHTWGIPPLWQGNGYKTHSWELGVSLIITPRKGHQHLLPSAHFHQAHWLPQPPVDASSEQLLVPPIAQVGSHTSELSSPSCLALYMISRSNKGLAKGRQTGNQKWSLPFTWSPSTPACSTCIQVAGAGKTSGPSSPALFNLIPPQGQSFRPHTLGI